MKTTILKLLLLSLFIGFFTSTTVKAQVLDNESRLSITLKDGTQLLLYAQVNKNRIKNYYYLPTEPRLSVKKDKTPQFLFTKFNTEETEELGGINGALLHLLMEWGLTPEQQKEVELILKNGEQGAIKGSILKGAADVSPDGDQSFRIISATLSDDKLAPIVVTSSKAPTVPGSKIAVATKLNADGAQLLASTFEESSSITDLSIELAFKYTVLMPAAKGKATVHWNKMHTQFQQDSASYKVTTGTRSRGNFIADAFLGRRTVVTSRSYDEARTSIESLVENEFITFEWEESMNDERITKMREAFYDFMLEKMANTSNEAEVTPPTAKEKEAMPNIKYGRKYTFNRTYFESNFKSGTKVFNFNAKLAVDKYFTVTGNLASWYNGVKDNKKCVSTVLLNDPFFQHRNINLILDLEAEEMFESEVNYVTVNVRKKRNSGNDFKDSKTIDRAYLKENGISASLTYARGDDKNSDVFEYKTQWSLRSGNIYPENSQWQKGDWESVTLIPPVTPRTIEFEADVDLLKSLGFTRATLLVRYYKFEKEIEESIPLRLSGEGFVEKMIFTDRDTQGFAYQVVLNHKDSDKGRMALGWKPKINDNYVYASIPQELIDDDPDYLNEIIRAGEVLTKPKSNGEVSKAGGILDKFKDVLKVVKEN